MADLSDLVTQTGVVAELKGVAPLMANMVEGGRTPIKSAKELEALGFSLVIFPGGIVRARAVAVATGGYTTQGLHPLLHSKVMPILSNSMVTRPLISAN